MAKLISILFIAVALSKLQGLEIDSNTEASSIYAIKADINLVDSKGRSFWDKKFIRYPANGAYSSAQITKTCNTKEYFEEVGLQTKLKDKTIVENFPMEQGEEIKIKSAALQNNKFMLKFGNLQTATWSIEFLDDTHIKSCSQYDSFTFCHKYILCP